PRQGIVCRGRRLRRPAVAQSLERSPRQTSHDRYWRCCYGPHVRNREKLSDQFAIRSSTRSRLVVARFFIPLAQIVLGGAHRRPRLAVRIEVFLGYDGDATLLAHLDDIEPPRRALEHPMLAFELGGDALDGAPDAERLAAAHAGERLLLFQHAR